MAVNVPQIDFYGMLSGLGKSYQEGLGRYRDDIAAEALKRYWDQRNAGVTAAPVPGLSGLGLANPPSNAVERGPDLPAPVPRATADAPLRAERGPDGFTNPYTRGATATGSLPRGERNNNPGNIEASAWTGDQPGFMGSDGRFARFDTPERGIAAMSRLLASYNSRGLVTPRQMIARWAPASENNVAAYLAGIGVDPDQPIDVRRNPDAARKLIAGMIRVENGRSSYGDDVIGRGYAMAFGDAGTNAAASPAVAAMPSGAGGAAPAVGGTVASGVASGNRIPGDLLATLMRSPQFRAVGEALLKEGVRPAGGQWSNWTDPAGNVWQKDPATGKIDLVYNNKSNAPVVNVNTGDGSSVDAYGARKFAEGAATANVKYFDDIVTAGGAARSMLGNLNALESVMAGANTGGLAETRVALQRVAEGLGIDTSEFGNLADAEAMVGIANRIAPSLRTPGSGAQSDFELRSFMSSLPGLAKSPTGNALIVGALRKFAERSIQEGAIANQALSGEISPSEGRRRIAALGPVMTREEMDAIRATAAGGGPQPGAAVMPTDRPAPAGVDPEAWKYMTEQERALWPAQ